MRRMYSAEITYEDYLVSLDECDLEAWLIRHLDADGQDEHISDEVAAHKAALRKIDSLKARDEYSLFRARIRKAVAVEDHRAMDEAEKKNPGFRAYVGRMEQYLELSAGRIDRELKNLFDGLKSPDAEQAQRFKSMYETMGLANKSYRDVEGLLPVLERARQPKGRHRLPTPWTNEIEHMDAMRLLVADGMSISQAARERANAEGRADGDERAKTLAGLYRQRANLRN